MSKFRKLIGRLLCVILAAAMILCVSGCVDKGPDDDPGASLIPEGTPLPSSSPDNSDNSGNSGTDDGPDVSMYEGLVISKVYANSAKKDAAICAGFIELYNSSASDMDCSGLALFCKSPAFSKYRAFLFGDTVIPSGGYYLIKCAYSDKYDHSPEIISVDNFDSFWNIELNAGELSLILTLKDNEPSPEALPEDHPGSVSRFRATDSYSFDTCKVGGLSKNECAVRVALTADSGWEVVELLRSTSAKLRQILPMYSGGPAGELKRCALNEVDFDHAAGFYNEGFYLGLKAEEGAVIYYTTDGSDPRTSKVRKRYSSPVLLEDTSEMKIGKFIKTNASRLGQSVSVPSGVKTLPGGHVIKACAVKDGEESEVYTASYFISPIFANFNVTIMSLSMDIDEFSGDEGFYNHYYGSENIQNPRGNGFMEVFDPAGNRQGYSNVELSVSGHGSSGVPMKSMKVFYKKSGNELGGCEDKLYYDLFEGYSVNEKGQRITDFARLLLRNSGNDYGSTYIRDAYMQRVSRVLNIDTMAYVPTLLFINGCFWGVYNARERYSGDYVESHHGIDKDNVALIESDYSQVHTNQNAPFVLTSGLDYDPDAFNTLVEYIKSRDLSVQKYYDYVAERLDIDSFIDMYVARLYFNAIDWPENNIKIWRNRAGEGDPSNYDTKWHFTLLDMDFGIGFYNSITHYSLNVWGTMHGTHCVVGSIMNQLLKNSGFKMAFVLRFCEVTQNLFTPEFLESELDVIVNDRAPFEYLQKLRWGVSQSAYDDGINVIREFVRKRNSVVYTTFLSEMGVSEAEIRSIMNKEATLSFKLSQIEKAYVDGKEIERNTYYKITEGSPLEFTVEVKVRSSYVLTAVVYRDYSGNVVKELDPALFKDNKIPIVLDAPIKVEIICEKKSK